MGTLCRVGHLVLILTALAAAPSAFAGSKPAFAATGAGPVIPFALQLKFEEARKLMSQSKWPEAVIVLRALLKDAPQYSPASVELARALTYIGRREEALSALSQAASHERGQKKEMLLRRAGVVSRTFLTNAGFQGYQEGVNFLQARKYKNARERFERVLEQEPDNVEVLLRVGQCLVLESDFDSAAERLKLALKLNPGEPEIRLWLGKALEQRGEMNAAITELREAQRALKESELAPMWLAEALQASGSRAQAIQVLEADLKAHPLHLTALYLMARLRFQGGSRDTQVAWDVRKEIQVLLSRLDQYSAERAPRSEGELGIDLRDQAELKSSVESLLQRVEARLQNQSQEESGDA